MHLHMAMHLAWAYECHHASLDAADHPASLASAIGVVCPAMRNFCRRSCAHVAHATSSCGPAYSLALVPPPYADQVVERHCQGLCYNCNEPNM